VDAEDGGNSHKERLAGLPAFLHEGNGLVSLCVGFVATGEALLGLVLVVPVVVVVVVEIVGLPVFVPEPSRPGATKS